MSETLIANRPTTPPPGATPANPAAVARTAQAFEAQALGALLQPMFATVDTARSSFGGGGAAEATWKPMFVDAIATRLAAAGGLGLAASVQAEMLRMQAAAQSQGDETTQSQGDEATQSQGAAAAQPNGAAAAQSNGGAAAGPTLNEGTTP